jgi:protein N-terminal methyltransferase
MAPSRPVGGPPKGGGGRRDQSSGRASTGRRQAPSAAAATAAAAAAAAAAIATAATRRRLAVLASSIKGGDDVGNFYDSHSALLREQASQRDLYYRTNAAWWKEGGGGGKTDDEEMTGDVGGEADATEGLAFLGRLIGANSRAHEESHGDSPLMQRRLAIDVGAGLGRVTRGVLLKWYDEVHLVEGDAAYCRRCRAKLGKKKGSRCLVTQCYLQDMTAATLGGRPADLVWVQWTFQYLTDIDVVDCLKTLALSLRPPVGVIVVKENRPYGTAREDRFQMDVPGGPNERYDITRSDAHHRFLFQMAGLTVQSTERGDETNTYVLGNHNCS